MRQTLSQEVSAETDKVKGSRFIAYARPCQEVSDAEDWVRKLWLSYPDARHICWAFQGASPDEIRYVDDGEPSGTAGKPILSVIVGQGLEYTAVAVIRYFGGTKLGTGGLARAYSAAAQCVLKSAKIRELNFLVDMTLSSAYRFERSVNHLLAQFNVTITQRSFEDDITISFSLRVEQGELLKEKITELTAGRAQLSQGEAYWG